MKSCQTKPSGMFPNKFLTRLNKNCSVDIARVLYFEWNYFGGFRAAFD